MINYILSSIPLAAPMATGRRWNYQRLAVHFFQHKNTKEIPVSGKMRVHPAHRLYVFERGLFFFCSPETEGEIFQTLTGDNLHGAFHVYVYHFCDLEVKVTGVSEKQNCDVVS